MSRSLPAMRAFLPLLTALVTTSGCIGTAASAPTFTDVDAKNPPIRPLVVTEPVKHDTDDPAIWINRADPAQSLVLGTDKDVDGALVVFGLDGKIRWDKTVRGLLRPNNVDIAYDVDLGGGVRADIAVVTERYAHRLRIYRLPDMVAVDGGGVPVFEGETARDCMGVALYRRPSDGALFAIVSRSEDGAPREGYLAQYRLVPRAEGGLRGEKARNLGTWSGRKEIEAIAVDSALGHVYYADEGYGIRKYPADPDAPAADRELAVFGTRGFAEDHEGITIYPRPDGTGYILVSNQQANTFRVFSRTADPEHRLLGSVRLSTEESDGSDLVQTEELPGFPGGLFVAMSTDRTFHYYSWRQLAAAAGLD